MGEHKTLYLARHAKSSWHHPGVRDHDRPLNARGLHDAPDMARRLAARSALPQCMVSSTALRAVTTARLIAEALQLDTTLLQENDQLYGAGSITFIAVIRELADDCTVALLVAHNPTVHDMIDTLTGTRTERVPTAAIATITFDVRSWAEVAPGTGTLVDFDYPKRNTP